MSNREQHHPEFKAVIALEALKGEEAVSKLASRFGVHPTSIDGNEPCFRAHQVSLSAAIARCLKSTKNKSKTCTRRSGSWRSPTVFCQTAQTLDRQVRRKLIEPNLPGLSVGKRWSLLSTSRPSL